MKELQSSLVAAKVNGTRWCRVAGLISLLIKARCVIVERDYDIQGCTLLKISKALKLAVSGRSSVKAMVVVEQKGPLLISLGKACDSLGGGAFRVFDM
jgi:hypothetical protein